ncbi:tRNA (guanosine(46)-N7)-methyltransferase TrmB [Pullulanibacillus sp. KACC 23026]|uniref:tRNA (guanosine(46)-N7)-methyltransferase TrmB n=1 Tax=Pullulanibacillus sp. KACC 23026 TaxID=3028315 RepID=UPI0023AEA0EF|nr:tRNA (guanosine(46)-N7)-methyltransferase TrmB [Pullulanibacillus sp. KACC 23026]WEG13859.1 tRNA (guanosine(46)-N7)-methyltransferase TrmB [Pullulanibacillus sp. KACC 23026]
MRVRHKPWAKDKIEAHPNWVISDPASMKGSWQKVFPVEQPLHIEVGMGKGQFITGMAKKHPDVNFIGMEFQGSVLVEALDKLLETPLENVRLLHNNAKDLAEYFAEGEVEVIYLNFSDPWPKKRHEKRRLTYSSFLETYKTLLSKEGHIELKTDNQGLFEYSLESFSDHGFIIRNVSLDLHGTGDLSIVKTEYEEKFSNKGQRIYRCEAWPK